MAQTQSSASHSSRGGGGMGILAIFISLLFIVGPLVFPVTGISINWLSQLMLVGFGVFLLVIGTVIVVFTRLYRIAAADEAFVRTGKGGPRVVVDGGAVVIPVLHQVTPVSLRTMKLVVERINENALVTKDKLRADVRAEFYVHVSKSAEDVLAAATSLGERATNPELVQQMVHEKLDGALRAVSMLKTFEELNSDRHGFATAVQAIVEKDLKHNGLTLETTTITRFDQTAIKWLKPEENVIDAEGAKTIAQITQKARVERNQFEREADKRVKEQDVERDQFLFQKGVERATVEADTQKQISVAQASAKQEAATYSSGQERLAETARVEKELAVAMAEVNKAKSVEVANQEREKAAQTAAIDKTKAVEVAEREKEITVAEKEKDRAVVEGQRAAAEAEAEKHKQAVRTVEVTQTAEREKEKSIIAEKAEIEKKRLRQQMEADVKAYAQVKEATGEQEAAEKKADARRKLAEADKVANTLEAEGEQAKAMVPVNVGKEQVEVKRKEVEVRREDLKNQADFESIARQLQVELARITAMREVGIAHANAVGAALSAAKMTVWGDPATVTRMMESFMNGQSSGQFMTGLVEATPALVKDAASGVFGNMTTLVAALAEKMTGKKVDHAKAEELVQALLGPAEK